MKPRSIAAIRPCFLPLVLTLAACSTVDNSPAPTNAADVAGKQVEEIMPGLLMGYIPQEDQLDSLKFVLPAPAEDSSRQEHDNAWADRMLELRGTARWELAISDADLHFPAANFGPG